MKRLITTCLVCVLMTTAAAWGVPAVSNISISFDENGNGNIINDAGLITPLEFGMGEPSVGGHETLYYILPYSVTEGDVVLYENQIQLALTGPVISDVLRFVNLATANQARVYVYSDAEGDEPSPELADTGIPTDFMGNVTAMTEQGTEDGWNGLNDYTPQLIAGAPSQPGSMTETTVTYNFTSDVPEPATICLLGLGALTLIRRK
jgi:hypothetical protein